MDNSILIDNDDSFPYLEILCNMVGFIVFIDQLHVVADTGIFIDDGVLDDSVFPYSDDWRTGHIVLVDFTQRLVAVGAHHDDVFQTYTGLNFRPDTDNGTFDFAPLDDAALADDGVFDAALDDLACGQVAGPGINLLIALIQIEGGKPVC